MILMFMLANTIVRVLSFFFFLKKNHQKFNNYKYFKSTLVKAGVELVSFFFLFFLTIWVSIVMISFFLVLVGYVFNVLVFSISYKSIYHVKIFMSGKKMS